MILGLVDEAVANGARQAQACALIDIDARTLERWREQGIGDDRRAGPKHPPANKLTPKERANVLEIANSKENRNLSPQQIVCRLATKGKYVASESSFSRILREKKQTGHRGHARHPKKRYRPEEYVATGPNQVWSWDITYLRMPIRGMFFYFYVVIDIWSRKIVAWTIELEESAEHAQVMIAAACEREGVERDQLVIHSDNGAAMKAATLLVFLQAIGVATSFSRPGVSNDNPYSEALFRTVKYRPEYPRKPFESLEHARCWATWFEAWYNTEHLHSAIKYVTPEQRHTGEDVAILAKRDAVYKAAKAQHPNRWSGETRDWTHEKIVVLNSEQRASAIAHELAREAM